MSSDNKKSAWEKYKESLGDSRPWDILDPNTKYVQKSVSEKRYSVCLSCPEFIKPTKQCKRCGCIMTLKVKLSNAECPIGKWGKE
jgi:hypothetical protein